ncbi:hypothetical protein EGW08_016133 [Elysia chlorotica]|uniref:Exonuclease 1 n=1 Tax=Elysia chlorotica TaxID=188477 RepID=A0A3S0ZF14_ELYCH|nr:hypothetical protein EGW08_016133 [Elysia chlorotica]
MGIQGLLPFLKKIHQPVNISDFKGCTVAVDAYCWLHKGAFSCAEKLAMGEKTDQYVYYCMKYVDYLLRKGLKPILVFDGCHLKSKEDVEKTRRGRRELNRKKAAQFLREGKKSEAKDCLQKCVDITPQMALNLMNVCRDRGVDCIVAPYEADAQLAFLSLSGIAQLVVTEDSDLLLFGCDKVIFKMDFFGNGVLIEKSRLNEVLAIQNSFYSFEKFRYMCILSGCDYLPSLPGIGLVKACKVLKTARQQELRLLLKKLPTYLKMNLVVTEEYVEKFIRADNTFLYQLVYDPLRRRMAPLNPYPPEVDPGELHYAGQYMPEEKAYQLALGNVDIHTHQCFAFFDPATFRPKTSERPQYRHQLSIWDPEYRVKGGSPCKPIQTCSAERSQLTTVQGKSRKVHVELPKRVPIKPEVMQEPGKLPAAAERSLMSQYEALSDSAGNEEKVAPSQKENYLEDDPPCDNDTVTRDDRERALRASPKKGTKRKTPSWLEETAIEACPGESSPGKGRNVFAVSPARKSGRFNLEVHALRVKSRYFGNAVAQCKTKTEGPPPIASPSQTRVDTSSPRSQSDKAKCLTVPKNRLLSMFENASVKIKTEKVEVKDSPQNESSKSGLHKYFQAKPASERDTVCRQAGSLDVKPDRDATLSHSPPGSDAKVPPQGKAGLKSRLSAFSWSKSGPMSRHLVRAPAPGDVRVSPSGSVRVSPSENVRVSPSGQPSGSVRVSPSENVRVSPSENVRVSPSENARISLSAEACPVKQGCEEILSDRDGMESTDSGVGHSLESLNASQIESLERGEATGDDGRQTADSAGDYSKSLPCEDIVKSLPPDLDSDDEVTELQSYSYKEYIQSLAGPHRSVGSEKGSPAPLPVQSSPAADRREELVAGRLGMTSGEDGPVSSSQRSIPGSKDLSCVDSGQDVVDLTDTDLGSPSSQASQKSMESRLSNLSGEWSMRSVVVFSLGLIGVGRNILLVIPYKTVLSIQLASIFWEPFRTRPKGAPFLSGFETLGSSLVGLMWAQNIEDLSRHS